MNSITSEIVAGVLPTASHKDVAEFVALASAGMPVLKPSPTASEKALNASPFVVTRDAAGNVLVAGRRYTLGGSPVIALREEHRGTHVMDAFMAVFVLDGTLTERMVCVDPQGNRIGGPFVSRLIPTD